MTYFALTLRAHSPLTIRADHAPGGAASVPYIPGTTLVGSLAAAYRLYYPDNETQFQDLFLNDQVWFPNLYPASFKNKDARNSVKAPVHPLPKTAQSCKRFPGFLSDDYEDEQPHGARDSLLDWALFSIATANQKPLEPEKLADFMEERGTCACKKPLDHFPGYYRQVGAKGSRYKAKIKTRLQTRNGINRVTGTVEESILYNRQVIEEDAQFWGVLRMPDGLAKSFQDFIEEVKRDDAGWLRIGTGRTRGLGKAGLDAVRLDDLTGVDDVKTQLQNFDTKLRETVKPFDLPLEPFYFALTLHSPAILSNGYQGYSTSIEGRTLLQEEKTLESILGLDKNTLKRVYQFSSTRRVTGWNELWGTPRANEIAIDTGSVFLFSCNKELDENLTQALYQLEEEGIGRRRSEGFGRICISDPFHREVELL